MRRSPSRSSHTIADASSLDGAGIDELRRRTMLGVFERLLVMRKFLAPALFGIALWIGLVDTAGWRRTLLFATASLLFGVIIHDAVIARRIARGESRERLPVPNLALIAFMQHAMIFASGGMRSPVLPLILPVAFMAGLLQSPRNSWWMIALLHLPALWLEAGVELSGVLDLTPTVLAGYGSPSPVLTLILALVMSVALCVTTIMSTTASAALNQMIGEALAARDAALLSRAEQTRALTTLSGEIAHELKNPLASVKGLAALIERSELPGKAAERMQVLRREVDRMQGILEEFLNFSRPLVPLDQREVELRELVDHIVELHEGVAAGARVQLLADGRVRLRCDPRKIEQVLINLVQNALEVAPPGSSVELAVRRDREWAHVEVRDAGPGLAAELRGRAFEPGVTGKADGSGLGLTVARMLARQHGGELELDDRSDGVRGCVASLRLPIAGLDPGAGGET